MSHHAWDANHGRHIQDRQNRLPAVAESKERTVELLATHRPVVDVGCGTGEGTVALGHAVVLAVPLRGFVGPHWSRQQQGSGAAQTGSPYSAHDYSLLWKRWSLAINVIRG